MLLYYHFLPFFRWYLLIKPNGMDANDVVQMSALNLLQTCTFGPMVLYILIWSWSNEQLSEYGSGAVSQPDEDTDGDRRWFLLVALFSMSFSFLITVIGFTPIHDVLITLADVRRIKNFGSQSAQETADDHLKETVATTKLYPDAHSAAVEMKKAVTARRATIIAMASTLLGENADYLAQVFHDAPMRDVLALQETALNVAARLSISIHLGVTARKTRRQAAPRGTDSTTSPSASARHVQVNVAAPAGMPVTGVSTTV